MSNYPTNLTEKKWQVIKNIVEPQERNIKNSLREILNGIFYVNKSGCQWRMLPSDFAPWQTVYYYFRKWKLEGVWEECNKSHKSVCLQVYLCTSQVDQDIKAVCAEYLYL